ncbi:hypothetical protein OHB35_14685 [Streptomyces phaeochromogenes]|uniref:Uncharacterized protein n=1 Tax=Streptomyces phaeochromogenes TaxID=1923 RepID=A0ABZ1HAM5_STRPH|nr:hypothetical protein [Streptomyces phaeochromogenes]WSD14391.1 hypothetical protein OHB35_14685 [Streptomyces phaeochromogenes]
MRNYHEERFSFETLPTAGGSLQAFGDADETFAEPVVEADSSSVSPEEAVTTYTVAFVKSGRRLSHGRERAPSACLVRVLRDAYLSQEALAGAEKGITRDRDGQVRVAGRQSVDQRRLGRPQGRVVSFQGHTCTDHFVGPALDPQGVDGRYQDIVAACAIQVPQKVLILVESIRDAPLDDGPVHPFTSAPHFVQVGAGDGRRALAGGLDLEDGPDLIEIQQFVNGELADPGATMGVRHGEAVLHQEPNRLSNRHDARSHLLGQVPDGQSVSRREFAVVNAFGEDLVDLVRDERRVDVLAPAASTCDH